MLRLSPTSSFRRAQGCYSRLEIWFQCRSLGKWKRINFRERIQAPMDNSCVLNRLKDAVSLGDSKALEKEAFDIGNAVLLEGAFPNGNFTALLTLLQDEQFLRMEGSWKLIRVFEENWDQLSPDQRTQLLSALERSYARFTDWMACFVISGILGEQYGDERAFDVLRRLNQSGKEMPRSFIPHGFEHIARQPLYPELAIRARAELSNMQRDASDMVRREVAESISRLEKANPKKPH